MTTTSGVRVLAAVAAIAVIGAGIGLSGGEAAAPPTERGADGGCSNPHFGGLLAPRFGSEGDYECSNQQATGH